MRFNLLLIFFATVVALATAELVLRARGIRPLLIAKPATVNLAESKFATHPALGYAHRPGTFTTAFSTSHSITMTHLPSGHRITKPLEKYGDQSVNDEVWIFGCSFTYGWSLADEETYPWLVQEKQPSYDILNFGVIGYGTVHSLIQLREALAQRNKPKAVIIAYASFHDERNAGLRERQKRFLASEIGSVGQPYARLNGQGELIYSTFNGFSEFPLMRYSALAHGVERAYNRIEDRFHHSHRVSRAVMRDFIELCHKNEIPLIVAGIMDDRLTRGMLGFARAQGVWAVDISVNLNRPGHRNRPYDRHPSAQANRKYARKLELFVRSTILDHPTVLTVK